MKKTQSTSLETQGLAMKQKIKIITIQHSVCLCLGIRGSPDSFHKWDDV